MTDLQRQVNARVSAFVEEITELARQSAYEMLSSALDQEQPGTDHTRRSASIPASPAPRRKGAKRTIEELEAMASEFLDYVTKNPGQRMEQIAKALGYSTQELTLPVKKLSNAGKVRVEGQKRATSYFPEEAKSSGGKSKTRRKGRRTRRKRS